MRALHVFLVVCAVVLTRAEVNITVLRAGPVRMVYAAVAEISASAEGWPNDRVQCVEHDVWQQTVGQHAAVIGYTTKLHFVQYYAPGGDVSPLHVELGEPGLDAFYAIVQTDCKYVLTSNMSGFKEYLVGSILYQKSINVPFSARARACPPGRTPHYGASQCSENSCTADMAFKGCY